MARGKVTASCEDMFVVAERDITTIAKTIEKFGLKDGNLNIKIVEDANLAVEKFLKGYLLKNNIEVLKIHELDTLHKMAFNNDTKFDNIKNECLLLNDYGSEVKYDPSLEVKEDTVEKVVEALSNVYNFSEIKTIRDELRKNNNDYPQKEYNLSEIINNYNNKNKKTY